MRRRLWKWRHRRHELVLRYWGDGAVFVCRHGHRLPALSSEVRLP
jgi:hypothetical protein